MAEERKVETIVEPDSEGMRLDLWLTKRFTYRSRAEWQRSIESGEILLNDAHTKSSRQLRTGEKIVYKPAAMEEPPVDPSFEVLAETADYLAVSKSGNLPCHPSGIFFNHTLWRLLCDRFGNDIHIVTRLDRETSGVVLAARNAETARKFTKLIMNGSQVEKVYYALVYGAFEKEITADGRLSDDPKAHVRKKRRFTSGIISEGESSSTVLIPLKTNGKYSLVEARPKTGRLHQIRATLCSLGFPLIGDKLYGPDDQLYLRFIADELTDSDRALLVLKRQALHAGRLKIGDLEFTAPMPPDMAEIADQLERLS